jgi:DNA polymerase III psi subunit
MNVDENFIKEVGIQQWKLNDSFQFKNNKIKVNKHIDFSKKEEEFLYTISKSFGLDFVEKDSLKIYKFLMKNNILIEPDIDKLMKDPDAKRKIWKENS